ncbi:MAG: hypothetical protein ACOYVJ_11525 [Nitrospirota bacterium]
MPLVDKINSRIIKHLLVILLIVAFNTILMACGSMLPSVKEKTKTHWSSFEEARAAFEKINVKNISRERHGSVMLDLLNFKRKTQESGWQFEALIVIVDNKVIYKLLGGKPMVDETRDTINPLGPLQDPSDLLIDTTKGRL